MTLREEIEALVGNANAVYSYDPNAHAYQHGIRDALAVIDSYTANGIPLLTYGAVDDKPAAPSSEERPAREALRAGYEHMDFTQSIMAQHGLAIIEAIDALTAEIRESRT